jgi:Skp family chaperone for outer membrane proteins
MMRMISVVAASTWLVAGAAAAYAAQAPNTSRTPAAQTPARPAAAPAAPARPATPVPFPADAKIGYVNIQEILDQSSIGKAGTAKMKDLTDKRNADIAAKNKDVQAKQQEITAGQNVLSATALSAKQGELASLQREVQFLQEQEQTDVQNLNDQLLDDFQDKVLPVIEKVRVEHNLWMVFTAGGQSNAVLAAAPGLDLSAEVVKMLDVTPAASAPATAAPTK